MASAENSPQLSGASGVLARVRNKGVVVWSEGGALRYRASTDGIKEELDSLRQYKAEILQLLAQERADHEAPFSYSQIAHWRLYRLNERPAIRQICAALRLTGELDIEVLQASLTSLVGRHEALRTYVVVRDGIPAQRVMASLDVKIGVEDLTAGDEQERERDITAEIDKTIMQPLDVTTAPLWTLRLLRRCKTEHVLIMAMEHLISDEASIGILLGELFCIYTDSILGRPCRLPPPPQQFPEYARWQRAVFQEASEHWQQFAGVGRRRFPDDRIQPGEHVGWGTVPVRFDRELTAQLNAWSRRHRTTLPMSVFTAYAALVLRWCGRSETVIRYQSDGRVHPRLSNAIGYFAAPLFLRVALGRDDSFIDMLTRLTAEYCNAYEHAETSNLAAQRGTIECARNTALNWIPRAKGIDLHELHSTEHELRCTSIHFPHPMLSKSTTDSEPVVLLYDGDQIRGDILFPRDRFRRVTIDRLANALLAMTRAMLENPQAPVPNVEAAPSMS